MNFERQFDAHGRRSTSSPSTRRAARRSRARAATATSSSRRCSSAPPRSRPTSLATGHYARVGYDEDRPPYVLRRGVDRRKDQSYFLFALTQAQLARAPLPGRRPGRRPRCARTRARRSLPVAEKPESREICFVPDGDYAGVRRAPRRRRARGRRRDRRRRRARARTPRRRPSLHRRPAQGPRPVGGGAALRARARRRRPARRRSGPKAALERDGARRRGEVTGLPARRRRAAPGAGADPLPARRRRRRRLTPLADGRGALRLRRAAAGGRAGPGRRLLRRRRGHRRRVDRLSRAIGLVRCAGKWCFEVVLRVDRGHAA